VTLKLWDSFLVIMLAGIAAVGVTFATLWQSGRDDQLPELPDSPTDQPYLPDPMIPPPRLDDDRTRKIPRNYRRRQEDGYG
jgi:hypothetical protein